MIKTPEGHLWWQLSSVDLTPTVAGASGHYEGLHPDCVIGLGPGPVPRWASCLLITQIIHFVHTSDYSCPKGKSKTKKIVLSPGDSFSYNTNFDDQYYPKTKCPVVYKAAKKCKAGIRFSCDSFDLPNRDSAKCRKGDRLILGKKA